MTRPNTEALELEKALREAYAQARIEKQYTAAMEAASLGSRLCPADMFWKVAVGESLRSSGKTVAAEKCVLQLISDLEPAHAVWRYQLELILGRIYDDLGQRDASEQWFRRATESRPTTTVPWIYLGDLLRRLGRLDEAERVLELGQGADGDQDEVALNLALCKVSRADFTSARDYLKIALKITPEYRSAKLLLEDIERAIYISSQFEVAVAQHARR